MHYLLMMQWWAGVRSMSNNKHNSTRMLLFTLTDQNSCSEPYSVSPRKANPCVALYYRVVAIRPDSKHSVQLRSGLTRLAVLAAHVCFCSKSVPTPVNIKPCAASWHSTWCQVLLTSHVIMWHHMSPLLDPIVVSVMWQDLMPGGQCCCGAQRSSPHRAFLVKTHDGSQKGLAVLL